MRGMKWIEGWDREQRHLLPEQVEDYIAADNPVRFLDAFVGTLDLRQAGFVFPKEDCQGRGRPSYHPGDLLKLYLYGYLHQIRSSRRLEEESARNLEVIWLLRKLKPDFKTIADFRKNNAGAFKNVVRQFTQLCRQLNLFGAELIAIDGTKIKAQNAPDKNWSRGKLQKQMQRIEQHLEEYLKALDEADGEGSVGRPSAVELREKIELLKRHREQAQQRMQRLEQSGESQLSQTDPDSRSMRCAGKHVVGYNVQAAVDAKHHLLVVSQVSQSGTDQGQLATVAQAAKRELQIQSADVVADGGYYKSQDIKTCQEMKMEPHLPAVCNSPSERAGLYGKGDFEYDPQKDVYRCPAGAGLARRRAMQDKHKLVFNYDNPSACKACPLKSKCTQANYRTVSRWEHEECLERMAQRVKAAPEKLARRKTLIEHCWGTIKWLLPGGFLVRGLKKVAAEVSLAHFGYNLKRALAVVGLMKLMAALHGGHDRLVIHLGYATC